jgi:transcriptional regulator with XRE-family HTH domain
VAFGDLLRRHRVAAGLTQEALAERARLSAFTISALERGANHVPRKDTLALLAEALRLATAERAILEAAARTVGVPSTASPSRAPAPTTSPLAVA